MFPPPRLVSPPPGYDTRSYSGTSSTSLRPYLQLPHILSLTWLAYPIISLLFVIFRLQLSSDEAQSSVANAKDDFLTACQAAEHAATAAASMPRYLAIATNQQFADAANGTMNGAREALVLALTCMEAIINFLISIYRSTFLCFLELVIVGGLDLLISAVQEITSFLQNSLNSIASSLKSDANSLNSAIQSAVNSVNSVNPFGKIQAPQFDVSSLDALSKITIPTDFENALIKLNNSLPTVSSIENAIKDLVDMPFEAVKTDINNTFLGLTFDPALLPVPAQNSVSFCGSLDTSSIDNLGNDLLQITKIGTMILIAVLFLLLVAHCVFEWYKWRCLMLHLQFTREAWISDPTTIHTGADAAPSVTLTDHNLLMLQIDAQHPLLTRIAFALAARLHLTTSQHVHLRWFLHYIFHPPALACFLIGFFGLLSVQIQLIAIGPLEAHYTAQVATSVQDLSNTIAVQMNNSMYNQSAAYANGVNTKVETVQSTVNDGLFGWVNGTTTTLNTTLNNFYSDVQHLVGTIFNGTILETPTQDFIKCLIGSKVDAIEQALTFLNHNLNVNLPQVNETILVLSPTDVNEITQPISTAAIGGSSGNSQGLVGRLVTTYVGSLKKERLMFCIFMGLWGVVVLMGIAIVFWHSYAKDWVDGYKKRKWKKEQRDDLEGFVMPTGEVGRVAHGGDIKDGTRISDPPLRSFTPLPEARSPHSINLFRRQNKPAHPSHPLDSLKPTFEKSWDSFFHEGANDKGQPDAPRFRHMISRPIKLKSFGKKGDEKVLGTSGGSHSEDKPKTVWLKPVAGLFSKNSNSMSAVSRPISGSRPPRLQLTISVEQASMATSKDFPKIESTPSPGRAEPSHASPAPPVLSLVKCIPPKKAIPLTVPPPPPGRLRNAGVPKVVESTPDHGPFALPLHNAFVERPASEKPVHPAYHPNFRASPSDSASSYERYKRPSAIPVTANRLPAGAAGPVNRYESTTSRLLTNTHAPSPGGPVDPFATPFDDDASIVKPPTTKRVTNPFAGFAM